MEAARNRCFVFGRSPLAISPWWCAVAVFAAIVLAHLGSPARCHAFRERAGQPWIDAPGCGCHQAPNFVNVPEIEADCKKCHTYTAADSFPFSGQPTSWKGPHGSYSVTSDRCDMCHSVHVSDGSVKLLPGNTVAESCESCHDGTGGYGVYGTIKARLGSDPAGGHGVETTSVIPGGDPASGGATARAFRGPASTLTCSDCHSPHDSDTVAPFSGERARMRAEHGWPTSNRLLKKRPTGAAYSSSEYGSDWCLSCHSGRSATGPLHNHPVETSATPGYFHYDRVVKYVAPPGWTNPLLFGAETSATQIGSLGGLYYYLITGSIKHAADNSTDGSLMAGGWLMPYPRLPQQQGHVPICQQCHEDAREAGTLTADGRKAVLATESVSMPTVDGRRNVTYPTLPEYANPRFQNFPHETENPSLLVEAGDDLCLNCHPPTALP